MSVAWVFICVWCCVCVCSILKVYIYIYIYIYRSFDVCSFSALDSTPFVDTLSAVFC